MMAFFFYDADQEDDADDGDDVEVHFEKHESDDGANACGGQRGDDRDGVDEAFVQDAKNNVDGKNGGEDKIAFVAKRVLISLQSAGEKAAKRGRRAYALLHLVDGQRRVAERDAWPEIEGSRDRWKEAGVIESERYRIRFSGSHGEERGVTGGGNTAATGGMKIDILEPIGSL